jgi:hypothetical protein
MRFTPLKTMPGVSFSSRYAGIRHLHTVKNQPHGLVEFPTKRDNIGLHQGDLRVTEVSPTRLSRPRQGQGRRAAKAIHRKAGQEGNFWPARNADAGHTHGFPLRTMRCSAGVNLRTGWAMSEVQVRTPFLPAMHVFRYVEPVRMYAAYSRADRP